MTDITPPAKKFFEIKDDTTVELTASPSVGMGDNSPHQVMLETISSMSRAKPQKNLDQVIINPVTRKTRVAMVMMPYWSRHHAPYNVARLIGLSKAAGYDSCAFDLNATAHAATDHKDLWHTYHAWKWENLHKYMSDIHPYIESALLAEIDRIVAFKPDVIGFSIYFCNNQTVAWAIPEIRKKLPNVKILAGGSQVIQGGLVRPDLFDHIVKGEGEQVFLEILESIEDGKPIEKFLFYPKDKKIDLDSMPWPDYSDFDLSLYEFGSAIGSEFSRGCVAKCEYCIETQFWRYRGRQATTVVDELEYQYKTFGVRILYFVDSLVNGNLKELRSFAQGLIDRGITDLLWAGYARADGRMDLAYLQDLKNSGCQMLNFGAESGSDRVLALMKKNVERAEMEQNFIDLKKVGINAYSNWIVGFPGEEILDVADTFIFLWRTRNSGLSHYSLNSCYNEPGTPLGTNPEKFNMSRTLWAGKWLTNDYSNTNIHRLIRYKSFLVHSSHMRRHLVRHDQGWGLGGMERYSFEKQYTFEYSPKNSRNVIEYDDFDYNIIKINVNPVADTVVNEIWPLLRVLYLAWGEYEFSMEFDQDKDYVEFGNHLVFDQDSDIKFRFDGNVWFKIDANGDWQVKLNYKFDSGLPEFSFDLHIDETGNWERVSR